MTSIQLNTSRTTWKHCQVYCVNRDCPRGHMRVTNWSINALLRNLRCIKTCSQTELRGLKVLRPHGAWVTEAIHAFACYVHPSVSSASEVRRLCQGIFTLVVFRTATCTFGYYTGTRTLPHSREHARGVLVRFVTTRC